VWSSAVDGRVLTFRLVGINNQNFVMRDDETGSWWQQVSGEAILGPLKGKRLTLLPFDHLTFALWREESPDGRVLAPVDAVVASNRYARADWEQRMTKTPAPASADRQLAPRTLVLGVEVRGVARAYPLAGMTAVGVVLDDIAGTPIAIVRAPDGRSTRVFDRTVDGRPLELIAKADVSPFRLADADTGSEWTFSGTAVRGPLKGRQLARIPFLEEYWFDWKAYHPATDVARHGFAR
jgi:Protein of unknown function (DUF3179)